MCFGWALDDIPFASQEHRSGKARQVRKCFLRATAGIHLNQMGMDQYLLIPFLRGWTSIYQLFWCSPGVQGFDTLPNRFSAKLWGNNARTAWTRRPVPKFKVQRPSRSIWIDMAYGSNQTNGDKMCAICSSNVQGSPRNSCLLSYLGSFF